jgi:thiol-disulfide isomerase/thioredoxin
MILRGIRVLLAAGERPIVPRYCQFSSKTAFRASTKNRIYTNIREPNELHTLLLLSSSSNRPLITLWTANWCRSCAAVAPIISDLIEKEGIGEDEGGLGYTEVEIHASTIGNLPITYAITSVPTLLAFSRSEPQMETRVQKVDDLKNREFLVRWLRTEAARGGMGGAGGSGRSLFEGWFGKS